MRAVGLGPNMYIEMVLALIEDLYVKFDKADFQLLVGRLRGEVSSNPYVSITPQQWNDPRETLFQNFISYPFQRLRITYRGLRRIEELRELLRQDRILDDFGVLLSIRHLRKDLEDVLQRSTDLAVSLLYLDMDDFGAINKKVCQAAGDVVMKAYLEAVRDGLGDFGTGYRGVGDEVVALISGQGHLKAMELAECIRKRIEDLTCEYNGRRLPPVTLSIGAATTPPESRTMDILTLADSRKKQAKEQGKNRVIGS